MGVVHSHQQQEGSGNSFLPVCVLSMQEVCKVTWKEEVPQLLGWTKRVLEAFERVISRVYD